MKQTSILKKVVSGVLSAALLTSSLGGAFAAPASAASVTSTTASQQNIKRNIMYYGDWSVWGGQGNFYVQDIPAEQLTHLNFAFMDFDAKGNLIFTDTDAATGVPMGQAGVTWGDTNAGILPAMVALRAQNPNMKIGVSLGGWSKSADFPLVAKDDAALENFASQVAKFVTYANMDFVDVDWEFPGSKREPDLIDNKNDEGTPYGSSADYELFPKLLKALRDKLDTLGEENGKYYELSVALHGTAAKIKEGVRSDVFDIVDFANLMTYDLAGAWDEQSGHQTALYSNADNTSLTANYSIDNVVTALLNEGVDSTKIVVGSAFYTRGWGSVADDGFDVTGRPGLGGTTSIAGKDADGSDSKGALNEAPLAIGDGGRRGGLWGYRNVDKNSDGTYSIGEYTNLVRYWDEEAQAPYLYNGKEFFTYDDEQSVTAKANYVNDKNLGGVISWQQANDKPSVSGSAKRDSLTKAIATALYGGTPASPTTIKYTPVDLSTTITPYTEYGNSGYTITVTNNSKLTESNTVLAAVEKESKTATLPKLHIQVPSGVTLSAGKYPSATTAQIGDEVLVDLASIYSYKQIAPGDTVEVNVKLDSGTPTLDKIKYITLTQRVTTDINIATGAEMKDQVIYSTTPIETPPVITGANDQTIYIGTTFNPLTGVSAKDSAGSALTIKITGTVDTSKAGTYTITYTATDSKGLTTTVTRKITVKEKIATPPVISGANDKTISVSSIFDPMTGVSAVDSDGKSLTVTVTGSVDTSKVGTYTLTYKATDSVGLSTTVTRVITVSEKTITPVTGAYGAGIGSEWPNQVLAPFVDMTDWISQSAYAISGAPNLLKISQETGLKRFNLGFIQSVNNTITNGKVNWGWGGYATLNETTADSQYNGMKQAIKTLRSSGGDVTISFGGLTGTAFWEVTNDVDVLTNTYLDIVDGYGLTRLDLDIEGSAQGVVSNTANAKAIKNVQDATGVEVTLTLAVLPSGLTDGKAVVDAYLQQGVDVKLVNLMTMCFGAVTGDYGDAAIEAVNNTKEQLKASYAAIGRTMTDAQLYAKLGTTPSIGFESSSFPTFTSAMMQKVVSHAVSSKLGMVSFWVMNRDAKIGSYATNPGVTTQYQFTSIAKQYPTGMVDTNTPPEITGVESVFIKNGDSFDPMAGVSATDKEDGNITSQIKVTGNVDTKTNGIYTLTYSVTDSKGATTSIKRQVTVNNTGYDPSIPMWSTEGEAAGYPEGALVIWNNAIWQQSQAGTLWWGEPGKVAAWVKIRDLSTTTVSVTGVSVSPTTLTLGVGGQKTLTATVTPSNADDKTVTWKSSTPAVATVSSTGVVTAVGKGTTTITVTTNDGGFTATSQVTVTGVAVTGVSVSPTSATLTIGEEKALTATVTPTNADNKTVTWKSSNTSVATVSTTGVVKAVGKGTAVITVTTNDGGFTATSQITVNGISVTGVSLVPASVTLKVGGQAALVATVTPSNADNKTVTWKSSNTSIATVDANGSVKAVGRGTATITVTTNDGGFTATSQVTVTGIAVTGVSVSPTSVTLTVGGQKTLAATVTPTDADDKTVTWKSSNTAVATVSATGVVKAVAKGTATITVTTNDGGFTATSQITVNGIAVRGVSVTPTSTTLSIGEKATLVATVNPTNADNKTVTWKSSNGSVATVNASGVVTAVGKGTATITVTTQDGGFTATSTVQVIEKQDIFTASDYYAGHDPKYAFDGNMSTYFAVKGTTNMWLAADFVTAKTFNTVDVTETSYMRVTGFDLLTSTDGVKWDLVKSIDGQTVAGKTRLYLGKTITAKYIKFVFRGTGEVNIAKIDFVVQEDTFTASDYYTGHEPKLAFDGNMSTYFAVKGKTNMWLAADFVEPKTFNTIDVSETSYMRVTGFDVMTSTDGVKWNLVKSIDGKTVAGKTTIQLNQTITTKYVKFVFRGTGEVNIAKIDFSVQQDTFAASDYYTGHDPKYAFDGNMSTYFAVKGKTNMWLSAKFVEAKKFNLLAVTETSYMRVTGFDLMTSTDGVNWTFVKSIDGKTVAGRTVLNLDTTVVSKYIKLVFRGTGEVNIADVDFGFVQPRTA